MRRSVLLAVAVLGSVWSGYVSSKSNFKFSISLTERDIQKCCAVPTPDKPPVGVMWRQGRCLCAGPRKCIKCYERARYNFSANHNYDVG